MTESSGISPQKDRVDSYGQLLKVEASTYQRYMKPL